MPANSENNNNNERWEKIEKALQELIEQGKQTDKRINSNAKSIEALSADRKAAEERLDRDRARLYEAMADLARAQAGYYERLEEVDKRQNKIVEILRLLTERNKEEND
ncbi:MAG: hypothetical protein QNJ54_37650 [Prochloraceae cyanobacterium]|nr:hypothetical protein [Prochloraceae cyanobacterium]